MAQKPSIPKGTRDFSPVEMLRRKYIFSTIEQVFQKYGFLPLETPAMENLETLDRQVWRGRGSVDLQDPGTRVGPSNQALRRRWRAWVIMPRSGSGLGSSATTDRK
jgi:hypothetical protein